MDILAIAGQYGWVVALLFVIVVVAFPPAARWFKSTIQRQWYKEDTAAAKQVELYERLLSAQQDQHEELLNVIQQNTEGYEHVITAIEENTTAVNEIRKAFQTEVTALAKTIRSLTTQVAEIVTQLVDLSRRVSDLEDK